MHVWFQVSYDQVNISGKTFWSSYKFYDKMCETSYFYLRLFDHKVTFCVMTIKMCKLHEKVLVN